MHPAIGWSSGVVGVRIFFWFCYYCFHVAHATIADFDDEFWLPEDLGALVGFREVLLEECFVDDFNEGRVEQNDLSFSVLVICGRT